MLWAEILAGAVLTLLITIIGAYARHVESSLKDKMEISDKSLRENIDANRISCDEAKKNFEEMEDKVHSHWEEDAKSYVLKKDFVTFAKDIKDSLVRIEEKIERLRN